MNLEVKSRQEKKNPIFIHLSKNSCPTFFQERGMTFWSLSLKGPTH